MEGDFQPTGVPGRYESGLFEINEIRAGLETRHVLGLYAPVRNLVFGCRQDVLFYSALVQPDELPFSVALIGANEDYFTYDGDGDELRVP